MCGLLYYSAKDIDSSLFEASLEKLNHRGPDDSKLLQTSTGLMGFKRLAIMDLSDHGNQPFVTHEIYLACNGEIYNSDALRAEFVDHEFISGSDCEVIIPLYLEYGIEQLLGKLDAEFSFVIYDERRDRLIAARDPMGIRPLFYGYSKVSKKIAFASEAKALVDFCDKIEAFPPGHYYQDGEFKLYQDLTKVSNSKTLDSGDLSEITDGIRSHLTEAVLKRLASDAPLGFLLSGGLDSSLVCAIAQKHSQTPIRTFAVGMAEDAIDLKYAKEVADYLGTDHTEIILTKEEAIESIQDVIYHLESFDITTVRASVGMYLICKHIREKTDIKVLLTGEVSDELFGYKYTDFAPSPIEFQKEAEKRIREIYEYDVLRADRCISAHSIEARVPFGDKAFVEFVMSIDPKIKMNSYGQGKYLLRKAFEGDLLPQSILYREKAAFSDAVGHSLVDEIKAHCEEAFTQKEFESKTEKYSHVKPISKESLFYRTVFEETYSKHETLIRDFWMPNKSWDNCDVDDPSARALPNYGKSGK